MCAFSKHVFSLADSVFVSSRVADSVLCSDHRNAQAELKTQLLILFLGSPEGSLLPSVFAAPPQSNPFSGRLIICLLTSGRNRPLFVRLLGEAFLTSEAAAEDSSLKDYSDEKTIIYQTFLFQS